MKKLLMLVPFVALLAGCFEKQDVAYWKTHPAERDSKIADCRGKSGAFDNDQVCIDAMLAEDVLPMSFWTDHGIERKQKVASCMEHSATIGKSPNCENAGKADIAKMGSGAPVYIAAPK